MAQPLIECVPNFSEGRNPETIQQITREIETVEGVRLLDVDPGKATNRTVVTFVGPPEPVTEAAFRAIRKAVELIDMRHHHGEHPRFGACDVCPLVPVSGISMGEVVEHAHRLAQRLGDELGLTIYCYENAAKKPDRRNLANVRAGEYERLAERLKDPNHKPDFGPDAFSAKSGATAVGARDFLVAYNVNLNTTSTRRANAVAFDVREKGRVKTDDGTPSGKPVLDENGDKVWTPGSLKCVKAIGWFIEEYGIAQISMNLTNISVTPIHVAFDECCERARDRGLRVTGSEVVGMVPLAAVLDAGRYFLRKQQRSLGVSDAELIKIAVKSMGLDELTPFNPQEKIIEYAIADRNKKRLVDLTVEQFVHETASESPAPGGGSVSAALGALGAALATMVANLSSHKRGWDDRWERFSGWAEIGKGFHDRFLRLIDADTDAFNRIMDAWRLPAGSDEEKAAKSQAVTDATKNAILVPFEIMQTACDCFELIQAMAETGLPASVSDAGVAAICVRAAVDGALLNVRINTKDLDDRPWADDILAKARELQSTAAHLEGHILKLVDKNL